MDKQSNKNQTEAEPDINNGNLLNPEDSAQAMLTVISGIQRGYIYYLNLGSYLFGRIEGYRINDSAASRRHMQIIYKDNDYILTDLDSTNRTYLNNSPVDKPIILKHGDLIRVGETILSFEISTKIPAVPEDGEEPIANTKYADREVAIQTKFLAPPFSDGELDTP